MLKLEGNYVGTKNGTWVSLQAALTSMVEEALLRTIQGPMVVGSDRFVLVNPDVTKSWRVSGPANEIAAIRKGWSFFAHWVSLECRYGEGAPHFGNPVYPGTPKFIPFFLKKILGGESATARKPKGVHNLKMCTPFLFIDQGVVRLRRITSLVDKYIQKWYTASSLDLKLNNSSTNSLQRRHVMNSFAIGDRVKINPDLNQTTILKITSLSGINPNLEYIVVGTEICPDIRCLKGVGPNGELLSHQLLRLADVPNVICDAN